jgi:hypothetical protein
MADWYIFRLMVTFPHFAILHQEKSGSPLKAMQKQHQMIKLA